MLSLAVDVGNSNIVIGLHRDNNWEHVFRYETANEQPGTFYLHGIQELLLEWGVHPHEIDLVSMSCVVPDLTDVLADVLLSVVGKEVILLQPDLYSSLPFRVPQPYDIGSDLVANAVAVRTAYASDCIVVDFGTALTFMVYHHDTGIEGVTIAPGIRTAIKALAGNTAQLPEADIALPASVIGKDTEHAIQAGVLHGYTGLVKHLLQSIQQETKRAYTVVATGGMASQLPLGNMVDHIDKSLTLDGIRLASMMA